ncbi:MAG: ankyrin repeat domain-containing protein [Sphingobacteriaceae bacterium]|nr:MAG: ankyrin repeat domain-containing protein [Sphingobacteriaceae bacterium]
MDINYQLINASRTGDLAQIENLLKQDAAINFQDDKGYTPPEIAELLIANGANLNLQHGNGGTALMFATMFGRNKLVKILLDHGAEIDILENRGLSAADLAVQQGNVEALEIMQHY